VEALPMISWNGRPSSRGTRRAFIAVALIGIAVTIHARIDDWKRGER
jgi:hypothetical protein